MATITGDSGDNTLNGTGTADDITGEAGNDTIFAGGGADVVDGGSGTLFNTDLFLDWTALGGDGTNLAGGFTQNTGGINVGVSFTNGGTGTAAVVETATTYTETGDPFDANSGLALQGSGGVGTTWTTTLDFTSVGGSGFSNDVSNVSFRIQDVDASGWEDIITVTALDRDGNPVEVRFTPAGDDTVSGNTVTAGASSTGVADAQGSVLVEIPGPVAQIIIQYDNGGTSGQYLVLTDVHFQAVSSDDDQIFGEAGNDTLSGNVGNDLIDGGTGEDVLDGGEGNDTLLGGAENDSVSGGEGNDQLSGGTGDDTLEGGGGNDSITGEAGADSLLGGQGNDTLQGGVGADTLEGGEGSDLLEGGDDADRITATGGDTVAGGEGGTDSDTLIVNDVERVDFDVLNGENGTVFFDDGTSATFTGIETLIVNGGPDGIVQGTNEADLIDESFVDQNLEEVDNNDGTLGTTGDQDVIEAGLHNDTVYAGQGDDTVTGGPASLQTADEFLDWSTATATSGGFSQTTGLATLDVTITDGGGLTSAAPSTVGQYVETGEPFDPASSLAIGGNGAANVAVLDFASDTPMTDISFRINDIDGGSWQDILTVNAFDADGNPVPVTITVEGDDALAGNTVTGGAVNDNANQANGSALFEIAGPVENFEIVYQNGSTGGQVIYVTDVHFTAVQTDDDRIHGDQGSDSLLGEAGDDTIFGDQLAFDPATQPSGGAGSATSVTFENQSPYAVQLAQIDTSGVLLSGATIAAGGSFTTPSTTETNWVLLDPDTGDILEVYIAPPDGSTQVFDSQAQDTLEGGAGNDSLSGDFGDDLLLGGDGADTLLGGTGDDTAQGGIGGDSLDGGSGADSLAGEAGADTLLGGDGADTLLGGADADDMSGGADADTFVIEDGFGNDIIAGGETGTDQDSIDYSALTAPINVQFNGDEAGTASNADGTQTFSEIEAITGSSGDDTLNAAASGLAQTLSGGDGADIITGGSSADSLEGGAGTDTLEGGAGSDTLVGTGDGDILNGGDDADYIIAGPNDVVDGGEGGLDDDTLYLGRFDFTITPDPSNAENGVVEFDDGSSLSFSNIENIIACFTPGTRITTLRGQVAVETLKEGDLVLTRDNGYQPILWIGRRSLGAEDLAGNPAFQPVLLRASSLAPGVPERDMLVSQQHRMLIENAATQLLLGRDEVLAKAKHLVHRPGIDLTHVDSITYLHVMFDAHEVILAENAWTESFQPGDMLSGAGDAEMTRELLELFPELKHFEGRAAYESARHAVKPFEARLLL